MSDSHGDIEFNFVNIAGGDFSEFGGNIHFENSSLEFVSFANVSLSKNFADSHLNFGITIENSNIYEIDFTDFFFAGNGLLFKGPSNVFQNEVKYPKAQEPMIRIGASRNKSFNISGAVFCQKSHLTLTEDGRTIFKEGDIVECWEQASQDFFDYAWYYADNPPVGVDLLPFEILLAPGCEKRAQREDIIDRTIFGRDAFDNCNNRTVITVPLPLDHEFAVHR